MEAHAEDVVKLFLQHDAVADVGGGAPVVVGEAHLSLGYFPVEVHRVAERPVAQEAVVGILHFAFFLCKCTYRCQH